MLSDREEQLKPLGLGKRNKTLGSECWYKISHCYMQSIPISQLVGEGLSQGTLPSTPDL
jgi:hypothetical protein